MAEIAPLTSAHSHARKAVEETQQVHWAPAADEHQSAATDFARAARTTSDSEALRILKLLEDQHHRLADIIRTQDVDGADHAVAESPASTAAAKQLKPAPEKTSTTRPQSTTSALAAARIGSHARDSSPSLAREIASRRGIPQSGRIQPSPAAQARAKQLSPESRRSSRTTQSTRVPPSIVDSQANLTKSRQLKKAEDDEGFTKFYNGLTTGTMSKLSSVLAYAGLPLTADDIKTDPSQSILSAIGGGKGKQTVSAGHEPDVKKYFSKAALNAIEEEHRQRGTLGRGFNPAESFYVVPTSGMMASFADIAHRRGSGVADDDGEFVDAREHAGPPSPKHSRSASGGRSNFGTALTPEELELENVTLKQTLEHLAVRLANFEAHAQDASMAALTQSMIALRPPANDAATKPADASERERELQRQVQAAAEEKAYWKEQASKEARENKKWNQRYEKLKEGAKAKVKAKEASAAGKGTESPVPGEPDELKPK